MMKWLRHRKMRGDRKAGMVFAWRIPMGRLGRMVASVLVVGVAAALFVSMVRVRVDSPPVHSQRRGTLMLEPEDGAGWFDRLCAESTPFPAPFDVWSFDDSTGALAKHPAWSATGGGGYAPKLRDMPIKVDLAPKREMRVDLPALPPIEAVRDVGGELGIVRRMPVLRADSPELAARIPVPVPAFRPDVASEPPPGEHRFFIEVDASGQVLSAEPMAPSGEAEEMEGVARWLWGVRFEPGQSGREWYVVTVTFVFTPDHD